MNDYKIVLYIITLLAICFIIYFLYKYSVFLYKKNRLNDFSMESKEEDITLNFRYKFFYKFANILSSMVIFNSISRTYDKYIMPNGKLRKGIDYIALKILIGFSLILLYIFMTILYQDNINILFLLITFILGFIIPDFYCYFKNYQKNHISNKDLLSAIIIMHNSYKVNRSTEQVLQDLINSLENPLKKEFERVYGDIKLGLSIGESFNRMYLRTDSKVILKISNILSLTNKDNSNLITSFEVIEKEIINSEKFDNEITFQQSINKSAYFIFLLMPLTFIITFILSNDKLLIILTSNEGMAIILILFILYTLYFFLLNKVVKGRYL